LIVGGAGCCLGTYCLAVSKDIFWKFCLALVNGAGGAGGGG